jgi:hypothetical protein
MTVGACIRYLLKFYRARTLLFSVSLLCLAICYLTVEVIFSFSSIIEQRSSASFRRYFGAGDRILSPGTGIRFDKEGELIRTDMLDGGLVREFRAVFDASAYRLVGSGDGGVSFIDISPRVPAAKLRDFCEQRGIGQLGSYAQGGGSRVLQGGGPVLYELSGAGNRFTLFSFDNQVSASLLGRELSSDLGFLSRVIFFSAALFTFYITLLYFRERKTEYSIFIIQGYTDLNLRITFIDCLLQNGIAFMLSLGVLFGILKAYTQTGEEFHAAIGGWLYILPYVPVIVIVQLLLLLNQSISHAAALR